MDCPLHQYISSSCSLLTWSQFDLIWDGYTCFVLPAISWSIISHPFTLSLCFSSEQRAWGAGCSWILFLNTSSHLYLLIGKFNPLIFSMITDEWGSPGGSGGKEFTCNGGDPSSISGSGRSPRGNGNPLQYSPLESSIDWGASQATVHGVAMSWDMTKWPNTFTFSPINEDSVLPFYL